jgi:DNA sulfur modification protein DndD
LGLAQRFGFARLKHLANQEKLLSLLTAYTPQHSPEIPIRDTLSRALRAERISQEIEKTLQEVSLLSEESKLQLRQLQDTQEQQQTLLEKYKNEERDIKSRLSGIEREIVTLENEISGLEKQARQSELARQRIGLLDKMQKLLATYKQQLKIRQRGILEDYYNRHLSSLLDSNRLITEVKIDEFFVLQYLDSNGGAVPMNSISAGMKQLAATALLWALKDACGKQLPVIVDTPLGRIDKQHQDNLLNRYYPQAARQVILLPTDSELDERKRQLLAPYIYREYQLHNEDGDKTRIELVKG